MPMFGTRFNQAIKVTYSSEMLFNNPLAINETALEVCCS